MSILSKDEILEQIKARLADDTSDEALKLVEDISDTFNDFDSKTKDSTDWKAKFEENDAMWRKKYRDRFFNSPSQDEDTNDKPSVEYTEEDENKKLTYDNLFKEETK